MSRESIRSSVQQAEPLDDIVGYFPFDPELMLFPDGESFNGAVTCTQPFVQGVGFHLILEWLHSGGPVALDRIVATEVKSRIKALDPQNKWGLHESELDPNHAQLSLLCYDDAISDRLWDEPVPTAAEIGKMAGYNIGEDAGNA